MESTKPLPPQTRNSTTADRNRSRLEPVTLKGEADLIALLKDDTEKHGPITDIRPASK